VRLLDGVATAGEQLPRLKRIEAALTAMEASHAAEVAEVEAAEAHAALGRIGAADKEHVLSIVEEGARREVAERYEAKLSQLLRQQEAQLRTVVADGEARLQREGLATDHSQHAGFVEGMGLVSGGIQEAQAKQHEVISRMEEVDAQLRRVSELTSLRGRVRRLWAEMDTAALLQAFGVGSTSVAAVAEVQGRAWDRAVARLRSQAATTVAERQAQADAVARLVVEREMEDKTAAELARQARVADVIITALAPPAARSTLRMLSGSPPAATKTRAVAMGRVVAFGRTYTLADAARSRAGDGGLASKRTPPRHRLVLQPTGVLTLVGGAPHALPPSPTPPPVPATDFPSAVEEELARLMAEFKPRPGVADASITIVRRCVNAFLRATTHAIPYSRPWAVVLKVSAAPTAILHFTTPPPSTPRIMHECRLPRSLRWWPTVS